MWLGNKRSSHLNEICENSVNVEQINEGFSVNSNVLTIPRPRTWSPSNGFGFSQPSKNKSRQSVS